MDLERCFHDFLEYLELERNVSRLTIRNYKHYIERFLVFLGAGPRTTTSITPEKIHEYRLFLSRYTDPAGISLKRVTQNYHLIALRSFLKFLIKRGIKVVSPETIELGKAESHSIKFLERDGVERLQKTLARLGFGSRRVCDNLIADGKVTVNGVVADLGRRIDPDHDEVAVDGVPVGVRPGLVYYLLHKPDGYVTTRRDRSDAKARARPNQAAAPRRTTTLRRGSPRPPRSQPFPLRALRAARGNPPSIATPPAPRPRERRSRSPTA